MSSEASPPRWHETTAKQLSDAVLRVNNSLSDSRVPFITLDPFQKVIRSYICGPTVYDSAHLGHARAYITFDIIYRILSDYFGYDVFSVMNITDVDDKIIMRARRNYLVKQYGQTVTLPQLFAEAEPLFPDFVAKRQAAVQEAEQKLQAATRTKKDLKDATNRLEETQLKLKNAQQLVQTAADTRASLQKAKPTDQAAISEYLAIVREPIAEWLDKRKGDTISDQSIFRSHAAFYEDEFLEDMKTLGVREPTVLTRVTEYVPEIVEYIKKIIAEGFAYESNGSVYFDVEFFSRTHNYAKLAPQHKGNLDLAEEGEGALGSSGEKKNKSDFALWKKSKGGEPFWDSPWGKGRPGWHIECSVMASDILGSKLDVHAGGVDLKFPHHDNELAQAEAHDHSHQWVNYFLHAGHLNMEGLKMSKSLKNFLTIREILQKFTARQIRLFFLSVDWDGPMNFNEEPLNHAVIREKLFNEFFLNTKALVRQLGPIGKADQHWDAEDRKAHDALLKVKQEVHMALLNNFDFPTALDRLCALVNVFNIYRRDAPKAKVLLLKEAMRFVDKILRVFGVIQSEEVGLITSSAGASNEAVLNPVLDAFTTFRHQVRTAAQKKQESKVILQACDAVRDSVLPPLGVRLEDQPDGSSIWKLDDPVALMRQRDEKMRQAAEAESKKLTNKRELAIKDYEKWLNASKTSQQVVQESGKFSQYDADGVPTHAADGAELSKNQRKAAQKDFEKQKEAHAALQQKLAGNPKFLDDLRATIDELTRAVAAAQGSLPIPK